MPILHRLTKFPRNIYSYKNVIQNCSKRNESFLSTSRQSSTLKTLFKASLVGITVGLPVGAVITTGYTWYVNKEASKTFHLQGKEQKVQVLAEKPAVPISRTV